MILQQFYLGCLAQASYIVADEATKAAVVIDPRRDIDDYLDFAADHDLHIGHVVLTHFHADFVAGHLELRNRCGAIVYLGAQAKAEYTFTPLGDGDAIDLGHVRLQALETPGHTVESLSLLAFDLDKSATLPEAVLTGDTLFVGDVGRPFRVALGWSALDLGAMLYDSVHTKLLPLPDSVVVYPGHGAGSLCGKAIGNETFTTMGEQRRANYALQPMTKDDFIAIVTADQPDAPSYLTYDAVLNTREHEPLDHTLASRLTPLGLDEALARQEAGAQLLDTRDPSEFAAAHLRGSLNIGLGGQFATWAGTLIDHDRHIVIIAEPGREQEAGVRLGRIGLDQIAGYFDGGMLTLTERSELTVRTERLSPQVAAARLASASSPTVVDVRAPHEYQRKRIAGATNVPLNHLGERADELQRDRSVVVLCAGGYRSMIAASLLQARGFEQVSEIAGGIAAWETAGLPTT